MTTGYSIHLFRFTPASKLWVIFGSIRDLSVTRGIGIRYTLVVSYISLAMHSMMLRFAKLNLYLYPAIILSSVEKDLNNSDFLGH
jgi:hypothetical protein